MSRIWESLYSKNGLAAKFIAKELLHVSVGERIPRISDFTDKLSLGRGTVQGALKVLEELHAISLESRGHLGTFLRKRDMDLLYEIVGVGAVIGVMPLPYSRKYEGLATGIVEAFHEINKKSGLAYMRGARRRLEALKSRRYDFAIMSMMAAEEALCEYDGLEISHAFGPETYVTAHRVFFSDRSRDTITNGMKIGIDYSSADQANITLAECEGLAVELVEVDYMQLFSMLKNGMIDAAVWNADETRASKAFQSAGFKSKKAQGLAMKATNAVIVIESNRDGIKEQLEMIDFHKIVVVQKLVEDEKKYPHY
ncbi:GntR family transcriptional regulator YhfZ [Lederbergia citrea]|uniref:GntR family transcriptional regulator YhfZ n=1 Tax=Lederbergia citrea TaxID=2833581 RepID=UPI001BC96DE2|nr:GntR family transcriptional regulator YhfZ [Lederbergia citrea]MBS4204819.1 transcriptional regulator [Lederbergia citrea]